MTDSRMTLSQAIRLGATMKPQAFDGNETERTCALRAAAEARGIPDSYSPPLKTWFINYEGLRTEWPILDQQGVPCPECKEYGSTYLVRVIYHLNDCHQWSRERIADFVELHEPMPVPLPEQVENVEAR